jgi:DNA-binding transcriptional LysR family regulator
VTLTEAGGVRLLDLVAHGDLDLAVGGILPGARFGGRLLFPIRLLAIAAAGRRWKQRATIEVVDLADEPLLLLNRDFGTRQLFDAACRITHIRPRGVLESNAVHSLIALAEAGHGIAVVPSTVRSANKAAWASLNTRVDRPLALVSRVLYSISQLPFTFERRAPKASP